VTVICYLQCTTSSRFLLETIALKIFTCYDFPQTGLRTKKFVFCKCCKELMLEVHHATRYTVYKIFSSWKQHATECSSREVLKHLSSCGSKCQETTAGHIKTIWTCRCPVPCIGFKRYDKAETKIVTQMPRHSPNKHPRRSAMKSRTSLKLNKIYDRVINFPCV
jgi:hypothetical protein